MKEPLLQSFTITARAIRPVADETVKLGRILESWKLIQSWIISQGRPKGPKAFVGFAGRAFNALLGITILRQGLTCIEVDRRSVVVVVVNMQRESMECVKI